MRFYWIFIIPVIGMLSSCLSDSGAPDLTGNQYVKDTVAIAAYLTQNNIAATKLPSGIWFIIDSAGGGIRATFNDSLKLRYTTRLLADQSIVEQFPLSKHFVLDSLIRGVQFAMPQFQAGSKGRIFIPSSYSTGLRNLQVVANLIFEFQLNEVSDYQLTLDSTAIDTFLSVRSISAIKDKSGLRYTIDTLKGGATPRLRDEVRVNYIAKNFSDGVILDQGTSVSFPLLNLILGWQIGLQKMPEGSTFTFYLPSSLAYGAYGNAATIKGNTILIFNVKLLAVTRH